MKTREFFEKRLHAPLVNQGWSWGAHDETHGRLFLRVHEISLKPNKQFPKRAIILKDSWFKEGSRGYHERARHIDALRKGMEGFAVVYNTVLTGDREKTKDFDRRFLWRLGKVTSSGGTIYAEVRDKVLVDDIAGTSANKREELEIDTEIARDIPTTERQALVKARVGQGLFRDQVLSLWSYQCAVTGCTVQEALRASHIKPWSESTDEERLDPSNGLPLVATLDALFDKNLIAFDSKGRMQVSKQLSSEERALLIPSPCNLRRPPAGRTVKYLKRHETLLRS